ncbi:LOW QUALITY PROTEIN: trichohyalin-like [Trematomus bernacchii]|uniref:LOW QUALITY PROTEIN: trichohyalin-like n=1 Tax=Trematomus bernacchii TaxID=40690 RepID=UPI00146F68DC|nr:LOW QUALITY PROTEIN: trichohyalin-like [Trematomus bernacchii]
MSLADLQWCPTSVQVTVLQSRGLRIKGKNGTNDAYAIMQVGKEKFQTSVVEKSVAPVWKEEAAFDLPPPGRGGPERSTLHVHVLHRALVGPDKLLGQAVINLLELSVDKTRSKTEWFKLLDKTGKADKDRGEVLVDIQFMRNNMTASMFDISAAGKSKSRLGKFKDKVRGKKKESDAASNMLPSFSQVLTDSEEEGNGEVTAGKDDKKKKHKIKSLFSTKSNLQKNMSQSMSILPVKNSSLSGSQSSGLNVDSSEGKKKFKFMNKRSGSSDGKDSGHQKQGAAEQSNLCINGSHVYREEPPPRSSRIGSNFSLTSSGHGSMEDVPENSPPSVDSLRAVRQYSPWTEEEEEEEEVENMEEDVEEQREEERIKMEKERSRKQEEEERVRKQEEELERLAEEKRLEEEERREEERVRKEEEDRIRREEEERAQEERRRQEEEERERLVEVERRQEEEERERLVEVKRRQEEEERERLVEVERRREEEERERVAEVKRRQEEEEREILVEVKRRQEEEERIEEERVRKEEEKRVEEERRRGEEEERARRQEDELAEEKRRLEEERQIEEEGFRKEEEKRREQERAEEERREREEEGGVRSEDEEHEKKRRREEQEERQREEEDRIRMEEERTQEERRRLEESARREEQCTLAEKRRVEEEGSFTEEMVREEERVRREKEAEEERIQRETEEMVREEERVRREEKEAERRQRETEEMVREEERVRREEKEAEEERIQRETEEMVREEERVRREEKEEERIQRETEEMVRRQQEEEQERRQREKEERMKTEEEEQTRREEETLRQEEERRKIEAEEKMKREERIRMEEEKMRRKEEEMRKEEERKQLVEEKRKLEEEEMRRIEEEERFRKEEERRRVERAKKEERLLEEKMRRETQRIEEEEKVKREEEERIRREEKAEDERGEEQARKLEEEKATRKAEKQKKDASQNKLKAAVEIPAEVSSNPFDEDPDSPAGADADKMSAIQHTDKISAIQHTDKMSAIQHTDKMSAIQHTDKMSAIQQRVQSAAPLVGSKSISTDEKDPISAQRERRLAPQPPGRNQDESQKDGSAQQLPQMTKKSSDKDIKTVSVLPQRSVQMIAPISRPSTDTKNTQSLTQSSATKETSNEAKHSKRPAPLKPLSVEEEPSSKPKITLSSDGSISHKCLSVAKQVPIAYGLNPFEDGEDDIAPEDEAAPSSETGSGQRPSVASQAADKDDASQTKIKPSKARAPLPSARKAATMSTLINQNKEGEHVTGATDNVTHASDPKSEAKKSIHVQEAPLRESQPATVQSAGEEAGGKKDGAPVPLRRLQPVKPLNPLEQQSVSVVQGERDTKSSRITCEDQEKTKVNAPSLKGPYSQLTQEELISLVLKQENKLSDRGKKISELELYIDNLLVRIIEEKPSILMSLNSAKKAA